MNSRPLEESEQRLACPLGNRAEDVRAWWAIHGRRNADVEPPLSAPIGRRILAYVERALERGGTLPLFELIERALRAFGLRRCVRSIRDYIEDVRAAGRWYVFKPRIGRSFEIFIQSKTRIPRAPISPCNPYTIGSQGGTNLKRGPKRRFSSIELFSFSIARACLKKHRLFGVCKILPDLRHAWRYALRWLLAGRLSDAIVEAYHRALEKRQADATDWGINHGCPVTVRWSPSSTVSLASKILSEQKCPDTYYAMVRRTREKLEKEKPPWV